MSTIGKVGEMRIIIDRSVSITCRTWASPGEQRHTKHTVAVSVESRAVVS